MIVAEPQSQPMTTSHLPDLDRSDRPDERRPGFCKRLWRGLQPAKPTRRATAWSSAIVTVTLGGFVGTRLMTGWGTAADVGIGAGIALLLVLVLPLLLLLAAALARSLTKFVGYGGVGAFLALTYLLDEFVLSFGNAALVAGGLVVLCGLVFGTLAAVTSGRFGARGFFGKAWLALCGTAGLAGTGWFVIFLASSGM